jgi:hypothetical protein
MKPTEGSAHREPHASTVAVQLLAREHAPDESPGASPRIGLNADEAASRLAQFGRNEIAREQATSPGGSLRASSAAP